MKDITLILNAWETPNGTLLVSRHRHDYVWVEENGFKYFVDGGLSYARTSSGLTSKCVYSDAPHEIQRDILDWGTRGVSGDEPPHRVKIKDMTTDHIKAVLEQPYKIASHLEDCMRAELDFRAND